MDLDISTPFRGSDAVRRGDLTRSVLVGSGFRKLGPDTFVSSDVTDSALVSVRALLVRGGPGAAATGWSACVALGLDVASRPVPVEIAAPGRRLAPARGTVVGQQHLVPDDVTSGTGVRTTTPLRTALDLARRTTPDRTGRAVEPLVDVVVACDALARLGGFSALDLAAFASARPGLRGVRGVGRVADLVDDRSDSPPETRARVAIVTAGLPRPVLQFPVANGSARPWLLDLAWPEFLVGLEYDGRDHALSDRRGRDIDRLDALRRRGWVIVVATGLQLRRPSWAPERVREALLARGWTPTDQSRIMIQRG